jgi:hypothetical protein
LSELIGDRESDDDCCVVFLLLGGHERSEVQSFSTLHGATAFTQKLCEILITAFEWPNEATSTAERDVLLKSNIAPSMYNYLPSILSLSLAHRCQNQFKIVHSQFSFITRFMRGKMMATFEGFSLLLQMCVHS